MSISKRAINFDLDTKKLKQYYPSKGILGYKKAYSDIKKFLLSNGFEHRQWSGYISKSNLTDYEICDTVNNLTLKFPWLSQCVKQFDVTDIGTVYSMKYAIQHPISNTNKSRSTSYQNLKSEPPKESLENRLARAKSMSQSMAAQRKETQNREVHKRDDISR